MRKILHQVCEEVGFMNRWGFRLSLAVAAIVCILLPSLVPPVWAVGPKRAIQVGLEYTRVTVALGTTVTLDMPIFNRGEQPEQIKVWVASAAKGWNAKVKAFNFDGVGGIVVDAGKTGKLTFEATPDKTTGAGNYAFEVKGETEDGTLSSRQDLVVTVEGGKGEGKAKPITLTTSYPVLRGPTGGKFAFSIDVRSEMDEEKTFNLSAQGPEGWEVNFKPSFEEKYISSVRMKKQQSQNLSVEAAPDPRAKAGEYPVKVIVTAGNARAEADLTVVLTGSYDLMAGTANDVLSLETQRGKEANISIYVKNTGSAPNENISFVSFKPENWKVEFKPEKLPVIEPGDLKQVEVSIKPADEALVGDYSVTLAVQGQKATKNIELRTTVKASMFSAWIGIAIIILVIAGLSYLFMKLGRR
jgi:uncharacterized membrane protein